MNDCGGVPDPGVSVAERLAGYLDCHAQAMAHSGFAGPASGWVGAAFLGGCLTIYVALIGYRLLLGLPFGPRDALLAAARAGVVIAVVTSWPAYETLALRVVFAGPAQLAGNLLPKDRIVVSAAEVAKRLDRDISSVKATASLAGGAPQASQPPDPNGKASEAPGAGRTSDPGGALVDLAVGSLGAIHLAAGLLLGLGPIFVVLALFDAALGFFEGWVRGLMAVFIASLGAMIVTSLEIDFIETQLITGLPMTQAIGQTLDPTLTTIATLFAMAMAAVAAAAVVIGISFRFSRFKPAGRPAAPVGPQAAGPVQPAWRSLEPVSRAEVLVDAVRRTARQEEGLPSRSNFLTHMVSQRILAPEASLQARVDGALQGPLRRLSPSSLQSRHQPPGPSQ